jgi:hypothetical protein
MNPDTGAFLVVARSILEGHAPYVRYVDHKPPGIYFVLAGILAISDSLLFGRVVLFVINLASAIGLGLLGTQLWTRRIGFVAGLLYLASMPLYEGTYLLTEPFVSVLVVSGLLCYQRFVTRDLLKWIAFSSALFSTAILFKQPAGAVGLAMVAHLMYLYYREPQILLRTLAVSALAAAVPFVVTLGWFHMYGAVDEAVFWAFTVNLTSYDSTSLGQTISNLYQIGDKFAVIWITSVVGLVGLLLRGEQDEKPLVGLVIIAFLFTLPVLLIRQYGHYFIHLLPFASLLGATGIKYITDDLAQSTTATKVAAVLALLVVLVPSVYGYGVAAVSVFPEQGLSHQQSVADEIAESTTEKELLIIGHEAEYYYLTGKKPVPSNIYYLPVNRGITYSEGSVRALVAEKDRSVIVVDPDQCWQLCDVAEDEYRLVEDFGEVVLYERS